MQRHVIMEKPTNKNEIITIDVLYSLTPTTPQSLVIEPCYFDKKSVDDIRITIGNYINWRTRNVNPKPVLTAEDLRVLNHHY